MVFKEFMKARKNFLNRHASYDPIVSKGGDVIRFVLLDETCSSNDLVNELDNATHSKFEKYWTNPSIVLLIATVLDPSLKVDYVRFYFHIVGDQKVSN